MPPKFRGCEGGSKVGVEVCGCRGTCRRKETKGLDSETGPRADCEVQTLKGVVEGTEKLLISRWISHQRETRNEKGQGNK